MSIRNLPCEILLASLFFCGVALFYSRPLFAVSDLWWHLSSGRWILEHLALPQFDPFSLLPNEVDSLREAQILKGYWLCQVFFFLVYGLSGMVGLVALKSALLTAIVFCSWLILVARGVHCLWGLLLVTPLAVYLREFDELRPHLFTFLGVVLIVLLLDLLLKRIKNPSPSVWLLAAAVPVIMIAWSNTHAGFVVGNGVVALYLGSEVIGFLRKKGKLPLRQLITFGMICVASVLSTLANPCNWTVYRLLLTEKNVGGKFADNITEYQPVWEYFSGTGEISFFYGLLLLLLSASLVIIFARRHMRMVDTCLLVVFSVAGFTSFRYSVFFVIAAVLLLAEGVSGRFFFERFRTVMVGRILVLLVVFYLASDMLQTSSVWRGPVALGSVDSAVTLVKKHALPGPLFTPYELGGYIQWALSPDYKTFVDPRTLNFELYEEYREVTRGRKAKVFQKYGFKTVVFYLNPPAKDQIPGLVFSLLGDKDWPLLYTDGGILVFSRGDSVDKLQSIDKVGYMMILERSLKKDMKEKPWDLSPLLDLGQLSYTQKKIKESRYYFSKALELDAQNAFALSWLNYLNSLGQ